ncbi:MAG: DUF2309 family protein [Chitinophagaceae bacterium]|nr:DUF2309 family protein [Chitinophagaceae bacterium]
MEVLSLWQDAFEWSYYDDVLSGLSKGNLIKATDPVGTSFQAMFCIDERECSLRRHIESIDPKCETFGSPGFFGVEFFFKPEHGKFTDKLCPAPVQPAYLIKEINTSKHLEKDILFDKQSYHPEKVGYTLLALFLGRYYVGEKSLFPKNEPRYFKCFWAYGC